MTTFEMKRGDTAVFQINVLSGDAETPLSLEGKEITMTVKKSTMSSAIITKTVGDGIAISESEVGQATITISPADTASLKPFTHRLPFDVQLSDSGNVYTIHSGILVVSSDITT